MPDESGDKDEQSGGDQPHKTNRFLGWMGAMVPRPGMLCVLIGIALALGWYFFSSEQRADHLVKRNFNYLNQVAANINASVEAGVAAVQFNSGEVQTCIEKDLNRSGLNARSQKEALLTALDEAARDCAKELRQSLVNRGSLVSEVADIEIRVEPVETDGTPTPGPAAQQGPRNALMQKLSDIPLEEFA